eukprot:768766-Hanusia_phi.AAC.5
MEGIRIPVGKVQGIQEDEGVTIGTVKLTIRIERRAIAKTKRSKRTKEEREIFVSDLQNAVFRRKVAEVGSVSTLARERRTRKPRRHAKVDEFGRTVRSRSASSESSRSPSPSTRRSRSRSRSKGRDRSRSRAKREPASRSRRSRSRSTDRSSALSSSSCRLILFHAGIVVQLAVAARARRVCARAGGERLLVHRILCGTAIARGVYSRPPCCSTDHYNSGIQGAGAGAGAGVVKEGETGGSPTCSDRRRVRATAGLMRIAGIMSNFRLEDINSRSSCSHLIDYNLSPIKAVAALLMSLHLLQTLIQ